MFTTSFTSRSSLRHSACQNLKPCVVRHYAKMNIAHPWSSSAHYHYLTSCWCTPFSLTEVGLGRPSQIKAAMHLWGNISASITCLHVPQCACEVQMMQHAGGDASWIITIQGMSAWRRGKVYFGYIRLQKKKKVETVVGKENVREFRHRTKIITLSQSTWIKKNQRQLSHYISY